VDKFFDRLGDIVNSFLGSLSDTISPKNRGARYEDPFMNEAWSELNDFLNDEEPSGRAQESRSRTEGSRQTYSESRNEKLAQAYANLELPYGAPFSEVRRAYKRLLRAYHPDRFAQDPEKLNIATEITKKINQAFTLIRQAKGQ
jgi:DnaJ-domain-containing protein 1